MSVLQNLRRRLPPGSRAKTAVSAVVFGFGAALPRALSLALLPVYTAVLAPEEYGRLSVLLTFAVALSFIAPLGVDLAVLRTYFRFRTDQERAEFVNLAWTFVAVSSPVVVAVVGALLWPLFSGLAGVRLDEYLLMLVGAGLASVAQPIPITILRAKQQLKSFALLTSVSGFLTAGLTVMAVAVFEFGVVGWLAAVVVSNLMMMPLAVRLIGFRRPEVRMTSDLREAVRLGRTFVPHYLSHWTLQSANRFIVAGALGAAAAGVFSLAANVAVPALIVAQSINQSLAPRYAAAAHDSEALRALPRLILTHVVVVVGATSLWLAAAQPVVDILAADQYQSAGELVGWLILGFLFFGLYFPAMNYVGLVVGAKRLTWLFPLAGVAVAVPGAQMFAGAGDLKGVAMSTAIGFAVLCLGSAAAAWILSRRRPEFSIEWPGLGLAGFLLASAGLMWCVLRVDTGSPWTTLAVRELFVVGAFGMLFLLRKQAPFSDRMRRRALS